MRLRFKENVSALSGNYGIGHEYDLPDPEAASYVRIGWADAVEPAQLPAGEAPPVPPETPPAQPEEQPQPPAEPGPKPRKGRKQS